MASAFALIIGCLAEHLVRVLGLCVTLFDVLYQVPTFSAVGRSHSPATPGRITPTGPRQSRDQAPAGLPSFDNHAPIARKPASMLAFRTRFLPSRPETA